MKAVRLTVPNNGMFHIGKDSITESNAIISSDTLFSAICNNIIMLYGVKKIEEFRDYLLNDLSISSIFHFFDIYKKEQENLELIDTCYFFPKPMITPKIIKKDKEFFSEQIKIWKKIQFISKDVLDNIINGKAIRFTANLILNNQYLISEKDYETLEFHNISDKIRESIKNRIILTRNITEQKVVISRINYESKDTFYQGNLQFRESNYYIFNKETKEKTNYIIKPGMFFLINNTKIPKEILAAIKIITDTGLGGKRSTGKGLFTECQISEFNFLTAEKSENENQYFTISTVIPNKNEIASLVKYTLTTKRGFMFSRESKTLRKKAITVLNEGSIFGAKINGKVVDVSPQEMNVHEIFRYGKAFLIPFKNKYG